MTLDTHFLQLKKLLGGTGMKEERGCETDILPAPAWGREFTMMSHGEPGVGLLQGYTPDLEGFGPQLPSAY